MKILNYEFFYSTRANKNGNYLPILPANALTLLQLRNVCSEPKILEVRTRFYKEFYFLSISNSISIIHFYFQGLVLLASASGNAKMMQTIADSAKEKGQNNISFLSYFTLGRLEDCLELLIQTNRLPEAAFFARTYLPSQISRIISLWRDELRKKNEKAAQALADPKDYENLFNGYQHTLRAEQYLARTRGKLVAASDYPNIAVSDCQLLLYCFLKLNFEHVVLAQ